MESSKSVAVKNPQMKDFWRAFEDFKSEFTRIQWTEEGEVAKTVKIVVISTFVAGLALYGADLFVRGFLHGFEVLFRAIAG